MLFSRGHAVGSIHWARLAKHEAEAAERELAEVRAQIARAKASAKAESLESDSESEPVVGVPLEPAEFTPEPVVPEPIAHIKVDGVAGGPGQMGTRPDDVHPGEVIESKPSFTAAPKRGPGRPRKDVGH